jgi:hypothetical protein
MFLLRTLMKDARGRLGIGGGYWLIEQTAFWRYVPFPSSLLPGIRPYLPDNTMQAEQMLEFLWGTCVSLVVTILLWFAVFLILKRGNADQRAASQETPIK